MARRLGETKGGWVKEDVSIICDVLEFLNGECIHSLLV